MTAPSLRSLRSLRALRIAAVAASVMALAAGGILLAAAPASPSTPPVAASAADAIALDAVPPARLSDTGLFTDTAARVVAPGVVPFSPQYPLWTDGAAKRRWILLPAGSTIDASDADAWRFPIGTKLWKEFAFGRAVETRYVARLADGRWLFAAYRWDDDGRDATLVADRGARAVAQIAPGVRHDIPSRTDCLACHGGRATPVLGFTALQLSTDRDPLAPHAEPPPAGAATLASLLAAGRLAGAPASLATAPPPRIAAPTPRARAALGYLHGNCAACHRASGDLERLALSFEAPLSAAPLSAALRAEAPPPALTTTANVPARFRFPDDTVASPRLVPGDPAHSTLVRRMVSRSPAEQMPPLGTHLVDREALELIEAWIREDLAPPRDTH